MNVNVRKCCITGALWRSGNALSPANRTLSASRLRKQIVTINSRSSPIPSIGPSDTYRVLGVDLNTPLTFTKHWHELKHTTTSLINALSTSLLHSPAEYDSSAVSSSANTSPSSSASSAIPSSTPSTAKSAAHSTPPSPRYATSRAQPSTAPLPTSATAFPPSKPTPHNSQSATYTKSLTPPATEGTWQEHTFTPFPPLTHTGPQSPSCHATPPHPHSDA
jgi:hypothetical protein